MPCGNAKDDGKATRSQSQNAPRLFQAVSEVKVEGEGEQRMLSSIVDLDLRPRPNIIGAFVGDEASLGGSFVVDGGFEPP